jgi:hypothetical protein
VGISGEVDMEIPPKGDLLAVVNYVIEIPSGNDIVGETQILGRVIEPFRRRCAAQV